MAKKLIINGAEVEPGKAIKLYKEVSAKDLDALLRSKKKDMGYKPVRKKLPV